MAPSASPRLDDFHGYHRGRRQSEPPELLMFTPERSRKSLPLLLDGNLPYRRSRRQSAPAKDLEAAFNSNALKPAGSDSTLASSVIEMEAEQEEASVTASVGAEEEDEEELNPLGPPPTLSITEEILEFINQSRAREGLAAISLTEPVQDHPEEVPPPFDFSCPLKPDVCPQTPEQTPQTEDNVMLQRETEKEIEVEEPEDESVVEINGEMLENNEINDEEDVGKKSPVSELHPEILKQYNEREEEEVDAVENTDVQNHQSSQRPKRDKTIIEKIRSYYEAAAEEDEGEDGGELDPKGSGSVNCVPCGTVKDQDEPESGNTNGEDSGPSTFPPQGSEGKPVTEEKILDQEEPNIQVDLHRTADEDIKDRVQSVCRELPRGKTNEEQCEQVKRRTGTRIPSPGNHTVINRHEPHLDQEVSGPSSCGEPPPNVKATQNGNLNSPIQAKASRWSRHSRIVTANRALFESMRSDLTGIGLFEATPVLMENSERILSKVQTLAQMYSTKASTMTVQPCMKRTSAPKNQSWISDRLPIQKQTQIPSVPQTLIAVKCPEQTQVSTGWSNTNEQSPTQLNISRKQTRASSHNQNQEDPKTQRERRGKKDENLTEKVQESATVIPEPWQFGHVTVGDQPQQTNNRVILSRPRDFISALMKAGEDVKLNPAFPSNETQKTSRSEQNDRFPRYTALENPSSKSIVAIPDCSQHTIPGSYRSEHGNEEHNNEQETSTTEEQFSRDVSTEPDYSVCTETAPGELGMMQNTYTQTSRMVQSHPTTGRVPTSHRETDSSPTESTVTPSGDKFNKFVDRNLRDEGLTTANPAHLLQSIDSLQTFTSRKTKDQTVHYTGKTDQRYLQEQSSRPIVDQSCLMDRPCPAPSAPLPSAFSLRQCPPSPLRAPPTSSSFRVIPAPSPNPTFPIPSSNALAGLAPPPSSDRVSSIRVPPPSSPGSSRRALFASSPPFLCSPPASSSSTFTRSLAASCISQSISQSMAKKKHQALPTGSSSPPAHLRRCPPSPKVSLMHQEHHPSPPPPPLWSSLLHSRPESSTNHSSVSNSSSCNGTFTNSCWQQKAPLTNRNAAVRQNNESHWSGSHNRVARPFPSSEPSSRVQSPTAFTQLCSPPAQNSCLANKPPCSSSLRVGGGPSRNPLGLTLEIPRTSSSMSPQILSPPPIGVSLNVWTSNIAAPQPRNPTFPSFPSTFGSPISETSSFVTNCTSRGSSPSRPHPAASRILHRSFSSSLADRSSTAVRSWVDGDRRSCDQQQSCPVSPRRGWMPCFSPGLQSPPPLSRFAPERSAVGGRHFTSVPWPDVRGLSNKYDDSDTPATSYVVNSCPAPDLNASHGSQSEWEDPDPEEGNCRSQLICAYVVRPLCERGPTSSGRTSTSPLSFLHQSQPHAQTGPAPSPSPMYPFPHSSFSNQGSPKASYATTVNLQIAGSGRITSFSTAHVSLTQTLQGGAGSRRASLNEPSQQNCSRP